MKKYKPKQNVHTYAHTNQSKQHITKITHDTHMPRTKHNAMFTIQINTIIHITHITNIFVNIKMCGATHCPHICIHKHKHTHKSNIHKLRITYLYVLTSSSIYLHIHQ